MVGREGQRVRSVGGEEEELETGSWALERTVYREMETARTQTRNWAAMRGITVETVSHQSPSQTVYLRRGGDKGVGRHWFPKYEV